MPLVEFNGARYKDLQVLPGQAPEILAQVGALMKSPQSPIAGLPLRRMVLAGTSASAGVRNAGAVTPIPDAHTVVSVRGPDAQKQLCGLAGDEVAFTVEQLRKLYRASTD